MLRIGSCAALPPERRGIRERSRPSKIAQAGRSTDRAILERGKAVFRVEGDAIHALGARIDGLFVTAVATVLRCEGRVVTTGVGKAGLIARKVAATLASTGSPSLFLHPAEALHGDLGMVTSADVLVALSYSGESDEVLRLLPSLKRIGACVIAITGSRSSTLAQAAGLVLDISVPAEACLLGLAPTTSAAAMLAMGDALAVAAMEARGFSKEEFALFHPAGALGKRLTVRVSDVMRTGTQVAIVKPDTRLQEVLFSITRAQAASALVLGHDGKLVGLLTDGDIRRALVANRDALERPASEFMTCEPLVLTGDPLASEALALFENARKRITEAPVVDAVGRAVGVLMLTDLMRCGIV